MGDEHPRVAEPRRVVALAHPPREILDSNNGEDHVEEEAHYGRVHNVRQRTEDRVHDQLHTWVASDHTQRPQRAERAELIIGLRDRALPVTSNGVLDKSGN